MVSCSDGKVKSDQTRSKLFLIESVVKETKRKKRKKKSLCTKIKKQNNKLWVSKKKRKRKILVVWKRKESRFAGSESEEIGSGEEKIKHK